MDFWETIRRDLEKEVRNGVKAIRDGATALREKAEELTDEGKRRYKAFELKSKARKCMTELGGRVYELSSGEKNPLLDRKVKLMLSRINKLEGQIGRLEGKPKVRTAGKRKKR